MKGENKKWNWELHELIDPSLSEEQIKNIINKKLAYIIVEMEHNPISYINEIKKIKKGVVQ